MKILSPKLKLFRLSSLEVAALMLLTLLASLDTPQTASAKAATWRDTGLTLSEEPYYSNTCFDATQPNVLLVSNAYADYGPVGSFAYNWVTGQRIQLNSRPFDVCISEMGLLFAFDQNGDTALRFSSRDPRGRTVSHGPDAYATDGTLQLYATPLDVHNGTKKLYASSDGGLTWNERGQQFGNKLRGIGVSRVDGRALYALLTEATGSDVKYSVYFSGDAGVTWEKRFESRTTTIGNSEIDVYLYTPEESGAPVNSVFLSISKGSRGGDGDEIWFSQDGGRNFKLAGHNWYGGAVYLFYSGGNLLRFSRDASYELAMSSNGGQTWQKLALPFTPSPDDLGHDIYHTIYAVPNAPSNLFFYTYTAGVSAGQPPRNSDNLWYSPDSGKSWEKLGSQLGEPMVTSYAPLTVLTTREKRLYAIDLTQADRTQTGAVKASGAPGSLYFSETGHNLPAMFRKYWEAKGGLAQFGYPKTEPFREFNLADGKIYTVQYFERNRFEYHPENAGTEYEVLLGLLGNQLTETRRASGEKPFSRTTNANYPGGIYFADTGHNLRGSFRSYWEANGGLSLYGYPISEEFEEVNPDDGKTYLVQYFERNRFEYHPENQGTKYEVLLGLLGNSLLRQKGWL
jgi:hypothetical protein